MYRPCDTGSCDPKRCDDSDCTGEEESVTIIYIDTKKEHNENEKQEQRGQHSTIH